MTRWRTGSFERDGEELYFEDTGDEASPAVVLSHGAGGNHAVWFQQVPALAAAGYRVVTWDQRGFGRSTDRNAGAGVHASVDDLLGLLDHLGLERAHLVGQSMGGWATLGAALADRAPALSVVLADSLGGVATPEGAAAFEQFGAALRARAGRPASLGGHVALGEGLARRDPARAFLYQQLATLTPPPPSRAVGALRSVTWDDDRLGRLACPVLCVVGADDPIFPAPAMASVAGRLDAHLEVVDGCGHSPYFEDPDAWNRAVIGFLAAADR